MSLSGKSSRTNHIQTILTDLYDVVNALPPEAHRPILEKIEALVAEISHLAAENESLQNNIRLARQSAVQMEATINSVSTGVIVFDQNNRVKTANASIIALFGFDPVHMVPQTIFNRLILTDENGKQLLFEEIANRFFVDESMVLNTPIMVTSTLGRERTVLVSALPMLIGNHAVGRVIVWNDITERQRLLVENLHQKDLLEAIFQADPGGIALFRLSDKICLMANRSFQAITSQPADSPVGKPIEALFTHQEYRHPVEILLQTAADGQNNFASFQTDGKEGGPRYLEARAQAIHWENARAALVFVWETTRLQQALAIMRKQKAEAEEGQRILSALMEYIPEGVTIADAPDVKIRYVSKYGLQLTGHSFDEISGTTMEEQPELWQVYDINTNTLIPAEQLPLSRATLFGEVIKNQELRILQASGDWITVLCNAGPILDPSGKITGAVISWNDITERKRLHDEIEQSEARFRVAMQNAPITVFSIGTDLRYVWVHNPHNGFAINELVGKTDAELFSAEDAAELTAFKQTVLASGNGDRREIKIQLNGITFIYDLALEPLRDDHNQIIGITGAALDVTEQRRLERRQIEYITQMEVQRRLLEHREMERQQIARDLHDGPIQNTIALMFSIQAAVESQDEAEIREILHQSSGEAQKLVAELRTVCNELRPPTIVQFGLAKSIRSHMSEFRQRNPGLRVWLDLAEDGRQIPDGTRLALFRIYQQSLNNILRHADAKEVRVSLALSNESAVLEIRDDGKGFQMPDDWVDLARRNHFGLVGIKERADAVGGKVSITSQVGHGTCIHVEVPMQKPNSTANA